MKNVPNALSLLNLGSGLAAVILALNGYIAAAGTVLLVGLVLDLWDGKIARMIGKTSELGKDLDSLADVVASGVAPGILFYVYFTTHDPVMGWIAFAKIGNINLLMLVLASGYAMSAAMRLAVYNNLADTSKYRGIPTTSANGVVITTAAFDAIPTGLISAFNLPVQIEFQYPWIVIAIVMVLLPVIMNSKIPYPRASPSLLGVPSGVKSLIVNILFILLIVFFLKIFLNIVFLLYFLVGPMIAARRKVGTPAPDTH